ncbi:putative serpin A13 [Myotis lucifugus]|uniref:putative serpin A13 n=1 Tax=Myotis lucifugus TaxID=59463 RepID=UPI000CCBDB5D|nr:putative serpin A13 [Myotis lucifugus]
MWLLVPALLAVGHCLALANQKDSGPMDPGPSDVPPGPALPCHKLSVSNIDFAFDLYRQLASEAPGENVLFSPVSISWALATLSLGAPAASRAHLLEGLGFNLTLVSEAEIQEGFRDLLRRLPVQGPQLLLTLGQRSFSGLGPGAAQDPAGAQHSIREYVEKQTRGQLGAWVEELSNATAEVLVSHLLLRGILRLSPEDSDLGGRELDFYFPKFSISSTARLELLLPGAAVGGGLPEQPGLNISKVAHKAAMTLDEAGTEVAAATSIQLTLGPRPDLNLDTSPAPDTEFNRPFLVMTFHTDTGSMLLLGRVVNPLG